MSPTQDRLKRRIEENKRVLERARQAEQRIQRNVKDSEKRACRIEEDLRRDGLLRNSS